MEEEEQATIHYRMQVLGCEVSIRVNSASLMPLVRDVEAEPEGERVASGVVAIDLLSTGDGFALSTNGAEVHRSRCAGEMARPLDTLIVREVCVRAQGLTLMRAGFVRVAGKNILLAGPGGSGKTSLLLELMVRGGEIRGKNVLLAGDGSIVPFPRRLRVREEMLEYHPNLREACRELNRYPSKRGGTAFYFDPTVVGSAWETQRGEPDLILHVEPAGGGDPGIRESGGGGMASRLLQLTDVTVEPRQHFRRMMGLVNSCPSHLLVPKDPKGAAESVLRLCADA